MKYFLMLAIAFGTQISFARGIEDDPNLEGRLDRLIPQQPIPGTEDRTEWVRIHTCTLIDRHGRKWYAEHRNRAQSCKLAFQKCVRNTSRRNCK